MYGYKNTTELMRIGGYFVCKSNDDKKLIVFYDFGEPKLYENFSYPNDDFGACQLAYDLETWVRESYGAAMWHKLGVKNGVAKGALIDYIINTLSKKLGRTIEKYSPSVLDRAYAEILEKYLDTKLANTAPTNSLIEVSLDNIITTYKESTYEEW